MGYGIVSRVFHWVTFILVLITVPVALTMTRLDRGALQDTLFIIHKGLGPFILVVVLLRLAWRIFNPPPPLPADIPVLQRNVSQMVHAGLYTALIVMGTSGYVRVTTGGFPLEWLRAIGIPPLLPKMEEVSKVAQAIHASAIVVLAALILVHVAAATYHGLLRRDGVISRMWPPFSAGKQ